MNGLEYILLFPFSSHHLFVFDSLSMIRAVTSLPSARGNSLSNIITEIHIVLNVILNSGQTQVNFIWVPSYSNFSGNEYAEYFAKSPAYWGEVFNLVSFSELIPYFKVVHEVFWFSYFVSFLSHKSSFYFSLQPEIPLRLVVLPSNVFDSYLYPNDMQTSF